MKYILTTLFFISLFIQVINILEVSRIVENQNLDFLKILHLSFLKLPNTMLEILPFGIVISTAFLYRYLITNNELISMRNIGFSIIDIFKPIGLAIFCLGTIFLLFINPISTAFEKRFEKENAKDVTNLYSIKIKNDEIWIKNINNKKNNFIKFTDIDLKKRVFKNIKIIEIEEEKYKFYLAEDAILIGKTLKLKNVKLFDIKNEDYENYGSLIINVNFDENDMVNSISNYKNIPFYKYYYHLKSLKKFNLYSPEIAFYYISQIFNPFFLVAISFVVMGFSSKFKRNENFFKIIFISISIGFSFFIFKEVLSVFTVMNYISFWIAYLIMITSCIVFGLYQSINIELN